MGVLEIKNNQRYVFVDILKGIGAIAVVMGHCWLWAIPYVYDFHLALFFLIAGYLYNEKKYGNNPFLDLGHKAERMWLKYVVYLGILTVFHNDLMDFGVYDVIDYYSYAMMVDSVFSSFIFINKAGRMAGALWFVSTLIVSVGFFSGAIWISKRLCIALGNFVKVKEQFVLPVVIIAAGALGVLVCVNGIQTTYHMEVALAVLPIMFMGYLLRVKKVNVDKYLNIFVVALACGILQYIKSNYGYIDLSASRVFSFTWLYLGSFAGIYICFYLAKIAIKWKYSTKILAIVGKYSFEIMALQFTVFKIFDVLYGKINGIPFSQYSRFPFAFDDLFGVYIILGVGIPVLIGFICEQVKMRISWWLFH